MHARSISRRFATGAVTLTLTLGGLAFTGGTAHAAPEAADRAASAECQQARKSVSKAKKSMRKAKRQGKAAKVRKAQRREAAQMKHSDTTGTKRVDAGCSVICAARARALRVLTSMRRGPGGLTILSAHAPR